MLAGALETSADYLCGLTDDPTPHGNAWVRLEADAPPFSRSCVSLHTIIGCGCPNVRELCLRGRKTPPINKITYNFHNPCRMWMSWDSAYHIQDTPMFPVAFCYLKRFCLQRSDTLSSLLHYCFSRWT